MNTNELAQANMRSIGMNTYPGRLMVLGVSESGEHLVQVYAITGRSQNSQNRVFGVEGDRVFTEAADPAKVKDPSLIIYNAMNYRKNNLRHYHIVSNGDQTDTAATYFPTSIGSLAEAISNRTFEPDAPNFTPRITGLCRLHDIGTYQCEIVVIKKAPESDGRVISSFEYENESIPPGFGYFVSTYTGDGNPLPSFVGEPLLVPIKGSSPEDVAQSFWDILDQANRVCLVVKFVNIMDRSSKIHTINRFTKVV